MHKLVPKGRLECHCLSVSASCNLTSLQTKNSLQTLANRLYVALHVSTVQRLGPCVYAQGIDQVSSSSEPRISRHLQYNLGHSVEFQGRQGQVKGCYQVGLDKYKKSCIG